MSQHVGFAAVAEAADCPVCGRAGTLVSLDCADDCPGECCDRLCVDCGAALLVDPVVTAGVTRTAGREAVARRRRSA